MEEATYLVEWKGELPHGLPGAQRLPIDLVGSPRIDSAAVLVLGPELIRLVPPESFLQRIDGDPSRVVLYVDGDVAACVPWVRAGFVRVCSTVPELRIALEMQRSLRVQLLAELARVRGRGIDDWAKRLGVSRRTLGRLCHTEFGESPARVWQRHLVREVAAGRAVGKTLTRLAEELGYSSASSLARAHATARRVLGDD